MSATYIEPPTVAHPHARARPSAGLAARNQRRSCAGCSAPQSIMSEIRSKLDATRSSAASMTSASTTFAPIARPQHGAFARLPASDEADSVSCSKCMCCMWRIKLYLPAAGILQALHVHQAAAGG
jgi:hypothetical protein